MNRQGTIFYCLLLGAALATGLGCASDSAPRALTADQQASEAFIDAFYSWDATRLAAAMQAPQDAARVLYYQAWAEAGNYKVQTRKPCVLGEGTNMICAITVTDDLGGALGYVATDTFTLRLDAGAITAVAFAGDDPPILQEVFGWMAQDRPEVLSGPCKDLFAGGTTPAACVREVVRGANDYVKQR